MTDKTIKYKRVKASGNTGRVTLPKAWIGQAVKIVLLSEDEAAEHNI